MTETEAKTGKQIIQEIIDVCSESIESDELGLCWEPIGRSDTYMIRNTLRSMLEYGYINDEAKIPTEAQENK